MFIIIERDLYTVDFGFGLKKNSGELKTQINYYKAQLNKINKLQAKAKKQFINLIH